MDYQTIIDGQLDSMDLSGLESMMSDAAGQGGIFGDMTVEQIINSMINGRPIFDTDSIIKNLTDLFLMEVRSSVFIGCEILAICIVTGLLTNFSNTFGSKTVSSLGTMICGIIITALCIGNFYQTYDYCSSTIGTMASAMEILLPIMIPLLISMGGISSGSIMDPVMAGAVTGFDFLMQHVVLPLVFLSAVFVMINGLTEKDYVNKLSKLLRNASVAVTGLLLVVLTGIISIQGLLTDTSDGLLLNTAKFSLSTFIPIVGGFTSDTVELFLRCMSSIKSVVGVFGIILILLLLLSPLLKVLVIAVIYKITAALAEPITDSKIAASLSDMGSCMISIGSIMFFTALLFIMFITTIIKIGGG